MKFCTAQLTWRAEGGRGKREASSAKKGGRRATDGGVVLEAELLVELVLGRERDDHHARHREAGVRLVGVERRELLDGLGAALVEAPGLGQEVVRREDRRLERAVHGGLGHLLLGVLDVGAPRQEDRAAAGLAAKQKKGAEQRGGGRGDEEREVGAEIHGRLMQASSVAGVEGRGWC